MENQEAVLPSKEQSLNKFGDVDLGGGYLISELNGYLGVIDKDHKPVVGIDKFEETYFDGKKLILARTRKGIVQDYSAATLPNSQILIFSDKFFALYTNPSKEKAMGYQQQEAVDMIIGHELTHIRFGSLSSEEINSMVEFYGSYWGLIHEFASALLSRPEYLKKIIEFTEKARAKDPNIKTRPVMVDNKKYNIAVVEVINELIAFGSGGELIGEERIQTLAGINPTNEAQSREKLAFLAYGTFKKIELSRKLQGKTEKLPGLSLYEGLKSGVALVKTSINKLL